jgi:hypothetical protein
LELFIERPSQQECAVKRIDEPTTSFEERLQRVAEEAKRQALHLPPGVERDALLRKVRQAQTAAHLNEWVSSPGLQPPK